jgi:TetR/AcrR family transcriptional regulator
MSSTAKPSKTDVVTDFRRSQLLDAARDRFGKHGLAGTTVDGIAKSAGVAKGTVYLYYKSKEDILRHVLDEDLRQLHNDTVPIITGTGSIEEKLERFFVSALTFFDLKRDFFEQVHFEMGTDVRKKCQQKLEVVFRAQVDSWEQTLADAQRAGIVGNLNLSASALMIVALASGLAKQRLRGWTSGPIEKLAEQTSATLWKGLAAR